MVKFPFPTSSLKCAMSDAAFPDGMLGARSRLKPLPLSLTGWYATCNNSNNNNIDNSNDPSFKPVCLNGLCGKAIIIVIIITMMGYV